MMIWSQGPERTVLLTLAHVERTEDRDHLRNLACIASFLGVNGLPASCTKIFKGLESSSCLSLDGDDTAGGSVAATKGL